jgi:DNA transposition AAA+ family ATPase
MSTTNTGVKGQVPLKNVASFMQLTVRLIEREPHLPGFGVCHGPSGFGKTYASIYAQNKTRAVRVEVGDSWTRKSFLKALLFELGAAPGRATINDMADQAKALLGDDPRRPLIIDEADKLVDKGMVELVREIGDVALCPVILIGEETLPKKLVAIERFHGRVLDWMGAERCDDEDTAALAKALCPGLTIAPDLLAEICRQSDGRARRIVVNLARATEIARNRGLTTMDRGAWGSLPFFTSKPPVPRNFDDPRRSA